MVQANGAVRPIVRKKAATCLLRLIRKSPPEAETLQPDVWSVKLVRQRPLLPVVHSRFVRFEWEAWLCQTLPPGPSNGRQ